MSDDNKGEALLVVLQHYGVVVHHGRNRQMCSCPFHPDRTPSMSVDLGKGVYNCHSCEQAGDAFSLIEAKEGLDFIEAKDFIAKLGVNVESAEREEVTGSLYGGRRVARKSAKPSAGGGWKPSWRR